MKKILFTLLLVNCLTMLRGQGTDSTEIKILDLVKDFTMSIAEKDSTRFMALFFTKDVAFTGVMTEKTEWSIKKDYPEFQGLSVSTAQQFISEICESPADHQERMYDFAVDVDGPLAAVEFDYVFESDNKVIQWGHERWHLVLAEGLWLITDVTYSIKFPNVEPLPERPQR